MKILMLGWELPPHNSGGLGVACYQLCKELSGKGVDIEFVLPHKFDGTVDFMRVTPAKPQNVTEVLRSGIAYDSYKYILSDGTEEVIDIYGQQQIYEHAVGRLIPSREFDVIHAHDWLTFRAGLRAQQLSGKPLILHVHSIESDRAGGRKGNPLVREIEETALLLADRVIAVSEHTKKAMVREYNLPADKIEVVHNSIDVATIQPLEGDNTYRYLVKMKSHGYQVVTNIGRLTVQKGLPNLLQAARAVIDKLPKTIFLIVGAGEQYQELIEQAARLGISKNVIMVGFQRGARWRDAFAVSDLFVMPSISEPFGLTPLEAAGYGTPSLISRQSGVAEVLQNCLKADFWDINRMADQIISVLRNPTLKGELTRNVERELGRFSWDKSADKLIGVYKQHHVARRVRAGAAA